MHVNGTPLSEPYVHFLEPPGESQPGDADYTEFDVRRQYGPVTVPASHYFVMGDNRDNSQDGRYWGFLPRDYIKGRALMVYWSYEAERDEYQQDGLGDQVGGLLSTIGSFFTKTRWSRIFHQIH